MAAGSAVTALSTASRVTLIPAKPNVRMKYCGKKSSAARVTATVTPDTATVRPAVATVRTTARSGVSPRARSSRNRLTMSSE